MSNKVFEERGYEDSAMFHGDPEILKIQMERILVDNENLNKKSNDRRELLIKEKTLIKSKNEELIQNRESKLNIIEEQISEWEIRILNLHLQMPSDLNGKTASDETAKTDGEDGSSPPDEQNAENEPTKPDDENAENLGNEKTKEPIDNKTTSKENDKLVIESQSNKFVESKWLTGLLVFALIFLTIYLFIFYSATFYSAYSKGRGEIVTETEPNIVPTDDIDTDDPTAKKPGRRESKILHFEAFSEVLKKPTTSEQIFGVVFLAVAPIIFYVLGLLIYGSKKLFIERNLRISFLVFLYSTAFILDVVIAYHIVKNNYIAEAKEFNISAVNPMPSWESLSWWNQIASIDFFSVMIGGFIVYLLWGHLLNWLMIHLNRSAHLKFQIDGIKNRINHLRDKSLDIKQKKSELINQNRDIDKQINIIRNQIVLDKPKVKVEVLSYTNGWLKSISGEKKEDKRTRERLFDNCLIVRRDFLTELDSSKYIPHQEKENPIEENPIEEDFVDGEILDDETVEGEKNV